MSGPDVLNQKEVAAILEEQLNRSVYVQEIGIEVWQEQAKSNGLGDYQIDTLVQMFRYYERYDFWGNPKVLGVLLGRTTRISHLVQNQPNVSGLFIIPCCIRRSRPCRIIGINFW